MSEINEYLKSLDNNKLINILTSNAEDYTEDTLEEVKEELLARGIDSGTVKSEYEAKMSETEIVLLTTTRSSKEATIFKSLFDVNNIPVVFRLKGEEGYINPENVDTEADIDIYVGVRLLDDAKVILKENMYELQSVLYKGNDIGEFDYEPIKEVSTDSLKDSEKTDETPEIDNLSGENIDYITEQDDAIQDIEELEEQKSGISMNVYIAIIAAVIVIGAIIRYGLSLLN